MRVAKDICLSEETVVKTRLKTNTECIETGQFCKSGREKGVCFGFVVICPPLLFQSVHAKVIAPWAKKFLGQAPRPP